MHVQCFRRSVTFKSKFSEAVAVLIALFKSSIFLLCSVLHAIDACIVFTACAYIAYLTDKYYEKDWGKIYTAKMDSLVPQFLKREIWPKWLTVGDEDGGEERVLPWHILTVLLAIGVFVFPGPILIFFKWMLVFAGISIVALFVSPYLNDYLEENDTDDFPDSVH